MKLSSLHKGQPIYVVVIKEDNTHKVFICNISDCGACGNSQSIFFVQFNYMDDHHKFYTVSQVTNFNVNEEIDHIKIENDNEIFYVFDKIEDATKFADTL